jgi:eukaryotic-like serine/threonine-protein kinase
MSEDRWIGRVIDNRYVVESVLGQGGMGVVLRARHKFTNAQVALKMLQPDMQVNEEAKSRFAAECQTPSTIGHPGIVQVTDAGETPQGELYLAMELLDGRTLRQAIYPPMPQQNARRIILELLDALGAAHARGIVHRDLKPENVFLAGATEKVKLLDFGIAKVLQTTRTAAGAMLGTVTYMAPEQLTDSSTVDARADLWAVGVIFYEMLAGRLPFPGTTLAEIVTALASRTPDPIRNYLPNATPSLEQFFARALARDREQRFASAQDFALLVSAVQIDGTAPGGPATTISGLAMPPVSAPHAWQRPSGSQPATPSQPMAAQPTPPVTAQPSQPFATPAWAPNTPPPSTAPVGPSPGVPSAMAPVGPPPGVPQLPTGSPALQSLKPYVPQPGDPPAPPPMQRAAYPQWTGTADGNASRTPDSSFGKTGWIIVGVAAAFIVMLLVFVRNKESGIKQKTEACEDGCEALSGCVDVSSCQSRCHFDGNVKDCMESSGSSCEALKACVGADSFMFRRTDFDRDNDLPEPDKLEDNNP